MERWQALSPPGLVIQRAASVANFIGSCPQPHRCERSSFMPYKLIVPKACAPPIAPTPPGNKAVSCVYVTGTPALDSNGSLVSKDDVKAQTRHILETIKAVLEAAGGSLKDVTFNQIFLSDMGGYAAMNEV